MKYLDFKMTYSMLIKDQVHELQDMVQRLKDFQGVILESIQVRVIIIELPSTQNEYKKNLLHIIGYFSSGKDTKSTSY